MNDGRFAKSRRIRVISDGTPFGTRVIDVESGELLPWSEVSFEHYNPEMAPEVTVTLFGVEVDAAGVLMDSRKLGFWQRLKTTVRILFPFERRRRHTPQEVARAIEIVREKEV